MTDGAIELHTVATPSPQVHAEFLDDQAVLYDATSARPVLLNLTASAVWAALDGRSSAAQVAADLAAHFRADADTVRRDVMAALRTFAELGLVTCVPPLTAGASGGSHF